MFDVAAAGNLLIFFSIFVALILLALLVLSYAAYSFLLTLTCTAAGNDEVIWPGEPIQDWLFKVWYLGWLLAVWAVPGSLVVRTFGLSGPLAALGLAGWVWLCFPVSLLSSLSAPSRLVVLRPVIVGLLLRHLGTTLRFYAGSSLVVLACGGLGYAALFGVHGVPLLDQPVILVPLAAVAAGTGCLVYARLLGRLAFLISRFSAGRRKQRSHERPEEADRVETFDPWSLPDEGQRPEAKPGPRRRSNKERLKAKKLQSGKRQQVVDPWALPADPPGRTKSKPASAAASLPEDPYGPAEGTYEILPPGVAPPAEESTSKASALDREEVEPYAVSSPLAGAPAKLPPPVPPALSKWEEELAAPRRLPPLPAWPFVTGVYSFPFYPQTVGPCASLILGFLGLSALLRLLLYLFRF